MYGFKSYIKNDTIKIMKIVSFDVGIKNLAVCVINIESQKINIVYWDVINLIDDVVCECMMTNKNGKKCKNMSKFIYNKTTYLCKKHAKDKDDSEIKKIVNKKVRNISLQDKNIILIKKLDELFENFKEAELVLIEQQPSKNPTMKNFSIMLHNFFIIRGMIDNEDSKIKNIKFVSPRNKLKVYNGPYVECKLKSKYARTKYLGTKYCEYILNNELSDTEEDICKFNKHKKKDDLADCLLQGLWYIKNNIALYNKE